MAKLNITGPMAQSFVAAFLLLILGDMLTYPSGGDGLGFEEGTTTAEIITVAPALVLVIGFYKSFEDSM